MTYETTINVIVKPDGFCIPEFGPNEIIQYTLRVNQSPLSVTGGGSALNGCTYTDIEFYTISTIFTDETPATG